MLKSLVPAAALAAASLTPAAALEVTKSAQIAAAPDKVWKTIGDFCGIGAWHPVVERCAPSETADKKTRTLSLKGGGTLVEALVARDEAGMGYTYVILEGPLPVQDYTSTIRVMPDGKGSKVVWTGTFKAKGAPDAEAEKVIGGVYDAGLKGIADKAM